MKRILISSLAALSLLTLSCQREEMGRVKPGEDEKEKKMIHVTFGASFDSPTDENGTKVTIDSAFIKWSAGDTIKVGGGGFPRAKFTLIAGAGSNSAKFEGNVIESGTYFAYYPFTLNSTGSGSEEALTYSTSVPSVQAIPAEKTVDPSAVIMFAATADTSNLPFQNAVSYLKVTPKVNCDKIVFRDTCSTAAPFAGDEVLSVAISKDAFTVTTLKRSGTTSDSLVAKGNFTAGSTYYLAVAPGKHQKGLNLDFLSSTGDTLARSSKSDSCYFEAGKVYNCGGGKIPCTDLSKDGDSTANCYIVSRAGLYKFKATKGNQSTPISGIASVKVLWETYGTLTAPSVGKIISGPAYGDDYISFKTNDTFNEGNALIAAYSGADGTGDILWSWHIWCTDRPKEQIYNNSAGTFLDRNLGATDTITQFTSFGLMYQWGRKDPFMGVGGYNSGYQSAVATLKFPDPVKTYSDGVLASDNTALAYSIKNPTTFIKNDYITSSPADWYCMVDTYQDKANRWSKEDAAKTIYDPCPAGWRIPTGGENSWYKAWGLTGKDFSTVGWQDKVGVDYGSTSSKPLSGTSSCVFYPASGERLPSTGKIGEFVKDTYIWSASDYYGSSESYKNDAFSITSTTTYAEYKLECAAGAAVRCVKD